VAKDRLQFFAKWVGYLWPDQESYWKQDEVDPKRLAGLYQETIRNAAQAVENVTA
jgi:hypothetical protein